MKIETALISVYDKKGVVELGRRLAEMDIKILSTGGTATTLKKAGIPVVAISEHTGFPEILGGRVKTLHPRVHGGILAQHDNPTHQRVLQENQIPPISLVVVNLYPFSETIRKPEVTIDEAIEQIDIGGPTMIRAAAKNHKYTTVIVDPEDYAEVVAQIESDRTVSEDRRLELACKAFHHTAAYDAAIASFFSDINPEEKDLPPTIDIRIGRDSALRYGENPHQQAALYKPLFSPEAGLVGGKQYQGKELSFNNYLDLESAWNLCQEFTDPACTIIKHTNPCGMALGNNLAEAYKKALACDPLSAFGSVIALNDKVDEKAAELMSELFVECIVAPAYDDNALAIFSGKKNLRVMELGCEIPKEQGDQAGLDFKKISGGFLVQQKDVNAPLVELETVTDRTPTKAEKDDLLFAWIVAKHVKSNAIVLSRDNQTLGLGAGQMSRVDSVRLAVEKAELDLGNCVMASDGFFPFRDAIDEAVTSGVRAIIQPGGSKRDEEVIAAANEHDLAMVLTGTRHFKH
ncbi:MAG: bifunctional phosphoribosylaminoimidazolecarboxamide formyltransferase/IMP cyclohydrolase [Acidobacteriota bacterium]|nr:bifunctional phosphoribosylaminoimidazolecarboxamide formyltransferase/IMP cyclohydrolase [Acidobacteriota bacterium]